MGREIKTSQGKKRSRHQKGRKGERSDWANGGLRSIVGLDMHTHVHVPIQRKTDKHTKTHTNTYKHTKTHTDWSMLRSNLARRGSIL